MSTQENKAMVRRDIEEVLNKGNLAIIPELIAHNYVLHGTGGWECKGPEDYEQGEYYGIAPTGKQFTTTSAAFTRFESGKQAESWMYIDSLSFYQQLGITPSSQ